MTNKEVYCLYRAQYMNSVFGTPLVEGWVTAEAEWRKGEAPTKPIDYEQDDLDDDIEGINYV